MMLEEKNTHPVTERQSLYRSEALATQRLTLLGETYLHIPITHRLYAIIALCVSMVIIMACFVFSYTTHQKVDGMIVPAGGLITMTAPIEGYVKNIYVHVGESVEKQTPLVELVNHRYLPKVGELQHHLLMSMQTQQPLLTDKLLAIRATEQQEQTLIEAEESEKTITIKNLNQEILTQSKAVLAADRVLQEYRSVRRHGLVSDPVLLQQQLTVAQVRNTLEDLKSQKAATLQQLKGMQQSAQMDRITARSQMDATRQQLHDLQQNILTLQGDNTALIRANHSGVISSCAIYPGEAVLAGSPLLSLMGKNGAVEAHLLVPSTVIPYLQRGTRVRIRYHAFPYQEFGIFHGTVQSMSKSALTPPEILSLTQQRVTKPMYLVKVSLQRHVIKLPHRQFVLRPGMKLNAIIALRTLRLYQWLFTPFAGLAHQVHFSW